MYCFTWQMDCEVTLKNLAQIVVGETNLVVKMFAQAWLLIALR